MTVRIERAGNRILLGSDSPTPGLSSAIPGSYFRKDKTWSLPLDLTTCLLLRERFGSRLEIGPALTSWARAEKVSRARAEATAAADDAELIVLPKVAPKLFLATADRRYQRSAIRYVADSKGRDGRRRALIGDTVGLGKTIEALGAILESDVPGPHLVVCPMGAVELAWAPEIRRWLPEDEVITVPSGRAKRDEILHALKARADYPQELGSLARTWVIVHPAIVRTQTWFVCGYGGGEAEAAPCVIRTKYKVGPMDYLDCGHEKDGRTKTIHEHEYPQLFGMEWGSIVADESDQMLIRLTGTPNLQRRGMEMLRDLVRLGGVRIAMSGTPFRSKPHQIWSTLNWLDPVEFSGKWRFIQRFWKTGGYSGYEIIKDGFMEEREAMLLDELKPIMIRRTREEVRGDLPAKLYPTNVSEESGLTPGIYLPMSAKQRKAYDAIVKQGEATIEGGTLSPLGVLAEMTRMEQFASAPGRVVNGEFIPLPEGNKFDWVVEKLKELGFPDRPETKVVIASQFTKLLNAFRDGVFKEFKQKIQHASITGEQTQAARTATVERFEDVGDELSLLWINTKAGGSAITLDAADIMIILDETYVDDEQQQLEGRIDNRNPERKIAPRSYYYLRSADSIEEHIAAANAEAKKAGRRILDGAAIAKRAKEFAR
jgi:SNF2 family DNA or RNA helicase